MTRRIILRRQLAMATLAVAAALWPGTVPAGPQEERILLIGHCLGVVEQRSGLTPLEITGLGWASRCEEDPIGLVRALQGGRLFPWNPLPAPPPQNPPPPQ